MSALPARGEVWWCESVSLGVLVDRLGRVADARMHQICGALKVAVDCA